MLKLSQSKKNIEYGGKINTLIDLIDYGFLVPDGIILSLHSLSQIYSDVLNSSFALTYNETLDRLNNINLPLEFIKELENQLDFSKYSYIVRSSSLLEDQNKASFAGQFESYGNKSNLAEVIQGMHQCLASLVSQINSDYQQKFSEKTDFIGMSLLIQEEVIPSYSGVIFTLDPELNNDYLGRCEYVCGHNRKILNGNASPKSVIIDWSNSEYQVIDQDSQILDINIQDIISYSLKAMNLFGYPLDIEFAFDQNNQFYFLQGRPITILNEIVSEGQWTNTNFRDGGVAAQDCPNLMWSLYRESWQLALGNYLVNNHFFTETEIPDLMILKYSRPYWNLGIVKKAMSLIPGYKEIEFDRELGVSHTYQGQGKSGEFSIFKLPKLIRIFLHVQSHKNKYIKAAPKKLKELLEKYRNYKEKIDEIDVNQVEDLENLWQEIINVAYLTSESIYFTQAFINTVQIAIAKKFLLKIMSANSFLKAISDINNVSHQRPIKELDKLGSLVQSQPFLKEKWKKMTHDQLKMEIAHHSDRVDIKYFINFIHDYGYHSARELDLRVPCFEEDYTFSIQYINNYQAKFENQSQVSDNYSNNKLIRELKKLLWWREEFKDISTRYYALIRWISLKLGKSYCLLGYLEKPDDIFYLKKEEINNFIKGDMSTNQIKEKIAINRHYCSSYRNAIVPDDLYSLQTEIKIKDYLSGILQGIPANNHLVQGRVRIIQEYSDLANIQRNQIIVLTYIDTGWTPIINKVAGIITETGGILSHASIIAREFGTPMIVSVKGASRLLRNGMLVEMDGNSGQIRIIREEACR